MIPEEIYDQRLGELNRHLDRHDKDIGEIYSKLDKYLPPWVVGAAYVLGCVTGCMATIIAVLAR